MKKVLLIALFALQACSESGLLPVTSGQGDTVAIPRVILNCQTAQCETNSASPRINVVITTSACSDARYGGVRSTSTRSISCTGTSGCYGELGGWVSSDGAISTLPSGTYNVCACINYTASGIPWVTCNTLGEKNNVLFDGNTGLQFLTTWTDQ
jgi:hypothetical protein